MGHSARSPLDAAAGAAGPHAVDAFKLLSDETRLAILLALWEFYNPYQTKEAVSFSELYDHVSVRDSANFTYHLEKLTGQFVEKTEEGYFLRNAGFRIIQAIIAGRGLDNGTSSPANLGIVCHRCGDGHLEISYYNEAVYLTCSDCEGFMEANGYPGGTIAKFELDSAGLDSRHPSELLAASAIRAWNNHRMMSQGVCPACSGSIDASLRLCDEHTPEPGGVCPNCGTRDSARVRYVCTVCKHRNRRPVELTVIDHPAVISFYYDHGVDLRWETDDVEQVIRVLKRLWNVEHTLVSMDPVRIRITLPCEGDELHVMVDEDWDVIDVRENDSGMRMAG